MIGGALVTRRVLMAWVLVLCLGLPSYADAALTFFSRDESSTLSGTDDYSAGDTTGADFLSPSYSTTYAKLATGNGVQFNANSEQVRFDNTAGSGIVNRLTGTFAAWVRWETWNTNTVFRSQGATTTNNIFLQGLGTDELRLSIGSSTPSTANLDTTTANLATGTWYFVVVSWDQPNSLRRIRVYATGDTDAASPSIADVSSSAGFTAPAALDNTTNGFLLGDANSPGAYELRQDNAFVWDTYAAGDSIAFTNRNIGTYTSYSEGGATLRNLMLLGVGQ